MHINAAQLLGLNKQTCKNAWYHEIKFAHRIRYCWMAYRVDGAQEMERNYRVGLVVCQWVGLT